MELPLAGLAVDPVIDLVLKPSNPAFADYNSLREMACRFEAIDLRS